MDSFTTIPVFITSFFGILSRGLIYLQLKMRSSSFAWLILVILFIVDWYVFTALRFVAQNNSDKSKTFIFILYWTVCIASLVFVAGFPYLSYFSRHTILRNYIFAIIVGLFFAKLIACVFLLLDDVRRLFLWLMAKLFPQTGADFTNETGAVTRSAFLSWIGLATGTTLFGTLLYGFKNKYNYQVKKLSLSFSNLPKAFKGLRVVHISDIHSGSFTNIQDVSKGVEQILALKPDIILFTGDLVNDRHEEMLPYLSLFSSLKAPLGVYSILGNHDYGDYIEWPSVEAKKQNMEKLMSIHASLGWRLLINEHVILEKDTDKIALLGIENWSAFGRFPKYGSMEKAYAGTENYPFKLLMSHDPSHWDAEVRTRYRDIDLMLAGHTHGMQFGIENPYFKWSPVQWFYKQWAGLYEVDKQKLYVNRGFGFIGYPGRVGILPEITVIELT